MKPGYITMIRRQNKNQWSGGITAHSAPKNSRVQKFAEKFLVSTFWDQDGILLIDYIPKDQTINAEYYLSLVVHLKDILKEIRRGKITKWVLFLHENAPIHPALVTQKKPAYLCFRYLDHPHYSPDLAPSEYHLFSGLKNQLKGRHFSSDAEIIPAVETWLVGQHFKFFLSGLQMLERRANTCTELRGEYVE